MKNLYVPIAVLLMCVLGCARKSNVAALNLRIASLEKRQSASTTALEWTENKLYDLHVALLKLEDTQRNNKRYLDEVDFRTSNLAGWENRVNNLEQYYFGLPVTLVLLGTPSSQRLESGLARLPRS